MLYICATPIGNLKDITIRALEILATADILLCEDTRVSLHLLSFHGITPKKMIALHEHNELEITNRILNYLEQNLTIVQLSDAGTPGISDPGARLCNACINHGFIPSPLPGACAFISLLSVSGINDRHILFYGFLPSSSGRRIKELEKFKSSPYAISLYEAPHRITDLLEDVIAVLGENCEVIMGRELTKKFETIKRLAAKEMLQFIQKDSNQQRGEFVLLIYPPIALKNNSDLQRDEIKLLDLLAKELPPKKVTQIVAEIYGGNKKHYYNYLLGKK